MKLSDLGEFGFITRIASRYSTQHPAIIKGIGDDAAALCFSDKEVVLFSTDQVIEGIHFRLETTDEWKLGWKSLAVNLSDIAAMGGTPLGFTLSLAVPTQRISVEFLDGFYDGLFSLARKTGVHLLGGDTSRSGAALIISVSIVGTAPREQVVYRSGGKDNDDLYITGWLGEAALGLAILEGGNRGSDVESLVERHLCPVARLREGKALAEHKIAHAMIDLSDGLLADARHLARESGLGVEIDTSLVPLSSALKRYAGDYGADPLTLALTGGEDYELLFSAAMERRKDIELLQRECSSPITRIGKLSRWAEGVTLRDEQGRTRKADVVGYDHFRLRV